MLTRSLLIPLVLFVLSSPARAQSAYVNATVETQPTIAAARINDEGQLVVKHISTKYVHEQMTGVTTVRKLKSETRVRKEKKTKDGREVEVDVEYTVEVPYEEQVTYTYTVSKGVPVEEEILYTQNAQTKEYHADQDGPAASFSETNGRKISAADLEERLQDWQLIVVTFDGKQVQDYYTHVFKPGTLIAALPRPMPKPMYYPAPEGAPLPMPVAPPQPPQEKAPVPPSGPAETKEDTIPIAFLQESDFEMPKSYPPSFAFAKIVDRQLNLRTFTERLEKRTASTNRAAVKDENGRTGGPSTQVELQHIVRTDDVWQLGLASVEVQTAGGQKLRGTDLPSHLPRERAVLITKAGRPIDPLWLSILKPNTLVISTPIPDEPGHRYGYGHASPPMAMPPQQAPAADDAPKPPAA